MVHLLESLNALESLPLHSLYSGERREAMSRAWSRAYTSLSLESALNALLLAGAGISFLFFISAGLLLGDLVLALGISLVLSALSMLAGFYLPNFMAARFSRTVEADLPLALRALALYLSIKMPLEQAIAQLSSEGYSSARLWKAVHQSISTGESVPRALSQTATLVQSMAFTRACAALITYYEEGGSIETLISLAEELSHQQLAQNREQSAKAGIGGLIYVALSSILPAFALVLMVAAGPILDIPSSPPIIWLLFLIILPLLNALTLLALLITAPSLAGSFRSEAVSRAVVQRLQQIGLGDFNWSKAIAISFVLVIISIIIGYFLPFGGLTLRIGFLLSLAPLMLLALIEGEVLGNVSALEAELPNLLLGAASYGRFSLERLLESALRMPAGPLRDQAQAALRQLRAGNNPLAVLGEWAANTPSVLLSRTLTLLSVGWRSGASMAKPLRALAADALSCGELVRERSTTLATQRYTLWAAGALLVPAILAVSLSFSAQVSVISAVSLGGSALASASPAPVVGAENISSDSNSASVDSSANSSSSASSNPSSSPSNPSTALVSAAAASVPLYLLINSLLCGLYLAMASGARERFIPYTAVLIVGSQLVWMLLAPGA